MKQVKRILCTALSLALIACLCAAPVSAADEGWRNAYRTVIDQNTDNGGCVCQLADFNLDGTPELLIGTLPGTGLFSVIKHAFTFRDGAAVEISVPDEYLKLGDGYELYRNDTTGVVRVEGNYTVRNSRSSMYEATAIYTFDGASFSYESTFVISEELSKKTYTVGNQAVSVGQYNSAYNTRNVGWTKIDFSAPSIAPAAKPGSADIDGLLSAYVTGSVLAEVSAQSLSVNGKTVSTGDKFLGAYVIGGSNYFKLRDLAMLLTDTGAKFEVGYDDSNNSITLTTGQSYTSTGLELNAQKSVNLLGVPTPSAIYIDGNEVSLSGYNIEGSNYFKLRDLGDALGFNVGWDDATRTVTITA